MNTSTTPPAGTPAPSALRRALQGVRGSFGAAALFSLFINLLFLVPSIYMLQVYDRVLPSGSESTLLVLSLLTVFLFVTMGGLEWIRSQIMVVAGAKLDHALGDDVFDAVHRQASVTGGREASAQPFADLLQLRQFLTGQGLFAFFDAPWLPIYVAVMFLFHPWFGVAALLSSAVIGALAWWNEVATRDDLRAANGRALQNQRHTERHLRNVETVAALGMLEPLRTRWQAGHRESLALQGRASERAGLIASLSRTFRMTSQSLILGLGAYLAIRQEITPGAVIAGSLLLGRALAPLDQLVGSWRSVLQARESYARLDRVLTLTAAARQPMTLPPPTGAIAVEKLVVVPPGSPEAVIKGVTLKIDAGSQVAVIGPSGAGKSTLARALLGLYAPVVGTVRLDGAEIDQWTRTDLGPYLGYLPQRVELLDGTIAENIARFGEVEGEKVVAAAQAAGVHELILRLPDGYDTMIQGDGNMLSAGQQQRIALARALYGDPRILVLDEPNANLDQEGDDALVAALAACRERGCTVVLVTHRANVLAQVDTVLMMADGRAALFGPRDEVIASMQARHGKVAVPAGPRPVNAPPALINQKFA